jgi:hypothetical protein
MTVYDASTVHVSATVDGRPRPRVRAHKRRLPEAVVHRVDPRVAAQAYELCQGDTRRLEFCEDGGILVYNRPLPGGPRFPAAWGPGRVDPR